MDVRGILSWIWHKKEAFLWIAALLAMAITDPHHHHYTLCPFNNLGWHFCPGCGIGRSIAFLFHLDPVSSFHAHPLGIPAVALILFRILRVFHFTNHFLTTPKTT